MKRHLRRILSLALLALLLVSAVPLSSAVAEGPFVIDNGVLREYNGPGGNVRIPRGVTEIGAGVFRGRIDLRTVTIPKGVTKIGNDAFNGCANLTRISIPRGVTEIGAWAFVGCERLKTVTIPRGVTAIEEATFYNCIGLKTVSIPRGVTTIGDAAFYGCKSLARISIPNTVTTIGGSAFIYCCSLTRVSIPGTVNTIGSNAFNGCYRLARVDMGRGVEIIMESAFDGCVALTDVELPNSLRTIGRFAFARCTGLSSITIPRSTAYIGAFAFHECPNLRVVTVPEEMEGALGAAFSGMHPEELYLPGDLLPPAIFLKVGQRMTLPKFKGAKVTWRVEGEDVATVGRGNRIRGVRAGEADLKMTVQAAAKGKALTLNGRPLVPGETHTIKLKVFGKKDPTARKVIVEPKKSVLHPLGKGGYEKTAKITLAFTPANLPESEKWAEKCFYTSNNPKVAQVRSDGTIIAVKPGKARITVYTPNMKTARVSVTVKGLATDLKLSAWGGEYVEELALSKGEIIWLDTEFDADAAYQAVRWSSSKPAVATVDGYGWVHAHSVGTAKITATAMDGSRKKATVIVTVVENIWN